ncbi:MAG TPA: NAD(P)-binding domain-containing protein [Bacteroidia bacterium]|nr:NAD(P)-binding domain-containing protein [Bacteroidia bacterium]
MKIAVMGTGVVGNTIASKLTELGHQVMMGSRTKDNEKAKSWAAENGKNASAGDYSDAAGFGEIVFNCTKGEASMEALKQAGEKNLESKIIIDLSNPLDSSKGMPPTLSISNTNSLGEEIQKAFPGSHVVKTLNTLWCGLMVNPRMLKDSHNIFMSGNNAEAKSKVKSLLKQFGWQDEEILDLGDISTARGTESYLPLWLRVYMSTNNGAFNIKIVR